MPTAAKLVAGLVYAVIAWLAADQYAAAMPPDQPSGWLREVSAAIGLVVGWRVMGGFLVRKRSRVEAMGTGLRTSLTVAFFALVAFSVAEMLARAIDGRYPDPMAAVTDVFAQALRLGEGLLNVNVLGVLLLGGLMGGALAHMASSKWK